MNKYLIIGGTGSLGRKLIHTLASEGKYLTVLSRDEAKHWTIKNEISMKPWKNKVNFMVGDVRNKQRIKQAIRETYCDVVIIAAALKQVDTCESSPNESLLTNVIGTQNVIEAVNEDRCEVDKVLFVSTDKACSPVNVYGMCKSISERLITSQQNENVNFFCIRYGNVLESRGSIIPLFKYQSQNCDHLTVTDPNMTRYLMTLDDAVKLIKNAVNNADNGDTFIPKIKSMKIGDLAEIYSEASGKPIKIVGRRPGEKLHEDLINEAESVRTKFINTKHDWNDNDLKSLEQLGCINCYVMKNSMSKIDKNASTFKLTSNDVILTKKELRDYLLELNILDAPLENFIANNIEEIRTS